MNRLARASSPYLLQHAGNPVDWWEWSDEAFADARERDVPVLLSVGYAACHWCHVMAHESFEDPATAALMNAGFVCIKVDREERPDVDAVYMDATQALTGHGGWPMTCFLTSDGKPFYCGTYFPSTPRHGMPTFPQLLAAIGDAWRNRRAEVTASADGIHGQLAVRQPPATGSPVSAALLDRAAGMLHDQADGANGGFGGAPKFPPSMAAEFLLRHHARTGDPRSLAVVTGACEAMARGGLYDQLGGGFARYSVDAAWMVPHFEKMLYDNALLLRLYAHWWRRTGSALAERVVAETAAFLLRELRTLEGGFGSALDADSEGVEGRFYVWTPTQLIDVLGPDDGVWAAEVFGVTPDGTFEDGASTLQLRDDPAAADFLADCRARLLAARDQRVRPGRDDKVVAAWNGLAIAALAEAGALFGRPSWVQAAEEAADLLVRVHLVGDRLLRTSRDGAAGPSAGVLEDYADVADGFLALFSATGNPHWVGLAGQLLDTVLDRFRVPSGAWYDTADDAEQLIRRPWDPTDNATPAGTTAAAGALVGYAALTGSSRHREAAEHALSVAAPLVAQQPRFAGWAAAVAEAVEAGPVEVAVVGPPSDPATDALLALARRSPSPGLVLAPGDGDSGPAVVPLLAARRTIGGRPAAYVCRGFVCERPTVDPAELADRLGVRPT